MDLEKPWSAMLLFQGKEMCYNRGYTCDFSPILATRRSWKSCVLRNPEVATRCDKSASTEVRRQSACAVRWMGPSNFLENPIQCVASLMRKIATRYDILIIANHERLFVWLFCAHLFVLRFDCCDFSRASLFDHANYSWLLPWWSFVRVTHLLVQSCMTWPLCSKS